VRLHSYRIAAAFLGVALFIAFYSGETALASSSHRGGVVTWAEAPAAPPNYIFPMENGTYYDTPDISDLAALLWPSLYGYGAKAEPVLNKPLSLAYPAVFSDHNTVVTINMKHEMWSDGAPVTARDVIFWINLLSAVTDPKAPAIGSTSAPGPGYGGASPGGFPENLVSYSATGEYSLVLHLNSSYSPTWFQYNELSQIIPMPQQAWDKFSSNGAVGNYDAEAETRIKAPASDGLPANSYVPANPGTATTGALGVAAFLNSQSEDLATYDTNPLWQVVDGPFKLTNLTSSGFVKFVPNKSYTGANKPTLSAFEEEPYTTDSAEFDALRSGSLTIGYVPPQDLSQKAELDKSGYKFSTWHIAAMSFITYNFTNLKSGKIFDQLYFRQAFQSLVNQPQYIKDFTNGIGTVANGPVPAWPVGNPNESQLESKGQVYPYDPSKAVELLKQHGWTVKPGGSTSCSHPGTGKGECGAGITAGEKASFSLLYASGQAPVANEMQTLQSVAKSKVGITLNLSDAPVNIIVGKLYVGCTTANPCNNWDLDMLYYTYDWAYGSDLPTGEETFLGGSPDNPGDYNSLTNNANIKATETASTPAAAKAALFQYENYLAKQLPVAWMPDEYYQLTMYKSDLKGLTPQGIAGGIWPQDYSLSGN
jgi:peptide/nickel transport system substrate-binding protein